MSNQSLFAFVQGKEKILFKATIKTKSGLVKTYIRAYDEGEAKRLAEEKHKGKAVKVEPVKKGE